MPSGGAIILVLKVLVAAVTLLLLVGLFALARGNQRLHGRINFVFFLLTAATVVAFEGLIRLGPVLEENWRITRGWTAQEKLALKIHLGFVIPLTVVMPAMLYTGWKHLRRAHVTLAVVFSILWCGMLVTGMLYLPHEPRPHTVDAVTVPTPGEVP